MTASPNSDAPLAGRGGLRRFAAVFVVSFGFYLLLGSLTVFDLVTGAASALACALALSRVTFTDGPTARTPARLARATLFVPYLLVEIARANVAVAAAVLDPRLPVDPSMERVEAAADSDLERAVLANSVTLTPGTLTVAVEGQTLVVHALTAASRESLRAGALERAVGYVFRGRGGREAEA